MERKILFRGKRVDNGEWVEGNYLAIYTSGLPVALIMGKNYDEEEKSITNHAAVISSTVGQYTGLTDKNGRRIFEGDILDLTYYLIADVGVVKFGEYKDLDMGDDYPCGHVGFYVDVEKQRISVRKDILFFASECKVVGNIHDNPELLKGENND